MSNFAMQGTVTCDAILRRIATFVEMLACYKLHHPIPAIFFKLAVFCK